MSTLSVNIFKVDEVRHHPVADRLDVCTVGGWNCVTPKDSVKTGGLVIYFPIDSVLPKELEDRIFGEKAKIKLNGKKVKTIKIRGEFSQGLAIPLNRFPEYATEKVGADLTERLGVVKWESPPDAYKGANFKGRQASKKELNPYFYKYTDLEHFRKRTAWFSENDDVIATEKLHGTSFRVGYLPISVNEYTPWWKKLALKLGWLSKYELCYGSRNVQLQTRFIKSRFTFKDLPGDVYTKILLQEKIKEKIKPGEAIFGEIVGHGIQKHYFYGHGPDKLSLYIYDIQIDGRWLNHDEIVLYCSARGLKMVPELYRGKFNFEQIQKHLTGPSTICEAFDQPIREGVVLRTLTEQVAPDGNSRKMAKYVSEEFLLRNDEDGTEFH